MSQVRTGGCQWRRGMCGAVNGGIYGTTVIWGKWVIPISVVIAEITIIITIIIIIIILYFFDTISAGVYHYLSTRIDGLVIFHVGYVLICLLL